MSESDKSIQTLLDLVYDEKTRLSNINKDAIREILEKNNIECIGHENYVVDRAYDHILRWNEQIINIIDTLRTITKKDDEVENEWEERKRRIIRECIKMIDELK